MMDKSRFGTFINSLRKEKGITQKELAEMLHVTDKAVSRWETGRSYPDIEVMQRIATYFDVSVNELLQGERISEEHIKSVSDRNVISAFKRLKKNKNRYEAVVAILVAVIVILGCVLYPRIGALLDGVKSTNLKVTSNDAEAIISCVDGYITSETGAPAEVNDMNITLHGDKTIVDMYISGASVDGYTLLCSVMKDSEVFPEVNIYQDKCKVEVKTTMTSQKLVEFINAIDFHQFDGDFSPEQQYWIMISDETIRDEYVQDRYDDNKAYIYDPDLIQFKEVPKGDTVKAPHLYMDIFKYDEYGTGHSIVHILWLM